MRRHTRPSLYLIFLLLPLSAAGQQQGGSETTSIVEERKQVLLYGIETEVIDVLDRIKTEPDPSYIEPLKALYGQTTSKKLKTAVLAYFSENGLPDLVPEAKETLDAYEDAFDTFGGAFLGDVLEYLKEVSPRDCEEVLATSFDALFSLNDEGLKTTLVRIAGDLQLSRHLERIRSIAEDDTASERIRMEALKTLGKMKDPGALETLRDVFDAEEKGLKRAACEAIGFLADPSTLPLVLKALQDQTDPYLRATAVRALSRFPDTEEIEVALQDALRDSFWRTRVAACEVLGEKGSRESIPILKYKAEKDPEFQVRQAAVKALSTIGTREAVGFLEALLLNERTSFQLRPVIAKELIDRHFSSVAETIEKTMAQEWEKENSQLLLTICKELSLKSDPGLSSLYERMLGHANFIIQIYGIEGIRRNRLTSFIPRLEEILATSKNNTLKKYAQAALDGLK
ncbi:PBS lyase HEAT domain protein repeat-containing protein [Spirochaeta thermophila DSM 6578]|uniref:PBS lyase HEAT domain protein repeat-containing protein n=1 Tax=Winmispira thermophila (strain ATCC 700085 / DSM 6578 / Z-1203) TaxID=869211 RepID=G0GE56_WINT7|nr:HEAT repeat domain-containing protein [Spirochaeta thermophila]AEJ61409.1 PBS lyase HEAT domain protein repeat-containing protein [Spirochaeta thermophila DSM 6578]